MNSVQARKTWPTRLLIAHLGGVAAAIALTSAPVAAADGQDSVGAAGAVISVDFLAAVRAAGITGTDPAMLKDGYSVCWDLWNQHASGTQIAADLVHDNPQLTIDQAGQFVLAAYHGLCPVAGGGSYDYWAYSTGGG
jgi:Protein of unknown function (DUF732)